VACAVSVQRGMAGRNASVPDDRCIVFRIGINLGDILIDGDDIFGDGVNVAARLEALCDPGGVCISRAANEQIRDKVSLAFADLGERTVKNIARSIGVFGLTAKDIAQLPEEMLPQETAEGSAVPPATVTQQIRFCRTVDGVQLAYARMGQGPPLVKAGAFLTHLEKDLESPIWRHLWRDLLRHYTVIRYDARGNGLSDWEVDDLSFDAFVQDLETVVDAVGLDHFPLLGISQGCAVSIAYAVRHPERVTRLILYGGFAQGPTKRARSAAEREQLAAVSTLVRLGWGQENPAFRQIFTSQFVPGGTKEQIDWFNEMQRVSASPENAARFLAAVGDIDVTDLLAKVTVPTLVMHARDEARVPFEAGRRNQMPKNILIFSDGTGQAGGVRPDQLLSNIYKLYGATRIGRDSIIDPAKQIAFYDPGLGSAEIPSPGLLQLATVIRKCLSSALGAGPGVFAPEPLNASMLTGIIAVMPDDLAGKRDRAPAACRLLLRPSQVGASVAMRRRPGSVDRWIDG
jgi:pimeloyl-ACP methyl ester carboxylesterase